MTDKPSPPPPPEPWMVALAEATIDSMMGLGRTRDEMRRDALALIQKHALPASSAREERLAAALIRIRDMDPYAPEVESWKWLVFWMAAEARKALEEKP